jgi:phage baseplate assembly protein gpV
MGRVVIVVGIITQVDSNARFLRLLEEESSNWRVIHRSRAPDC